MNRLTQIGFELAGHWKLEDEQLSLELIRHGSQKNILYAFVCDGEVKYVGKTVQTLARRMHGYRNPGETQMTNVKNHQNIRRLLNAGAAVDVLALPDNGLLHYGQFHVNLAAGLEDSIIAVIQPEWNGRPRQTAEETSHDDDLNPIRDRFHLTIHKTYFLSGFLNVPAAHADSFGGDGESIEIYCGQDSSPLTGTINRRSTQNNSPRLMGGAGLRDWLQDNVKVLDEVEVLVYSPNSIRLRPLAGN